MPTSQPRCCWISSSTSRRRHDLHDACRSFARGGCARCSRLRAGAGATRWRALMAMTAYEQLGRWIDQHHAQQVDFLREIVRVPSDTPPGDNAPAADKAATLLTALGFEVERFPVPADVLREHGLRS